MTSFNESPMFLSDMDVELVQANCSDQLVVAAARVSTLGEGSVLSEQTTDADAGLINFLTRNRHGSPFEQGSMTFRVKAPIFVWREHMRHRIGFSYNEHSARYSVLPSEFYVPAEGRDLQQEGKAGQYSFTPGTPEQWRLLHNEFGVAATIAYDCYTAMINAGVAREVARMVLPVNIYSSAYVTMNPRSLMNFLSLRTKNPDSRFPSFPQKEIQMVADQYESIWADLMPLSYKAFCDNGRVAP